MQSAGKFVETDDSEYLEEVGLGTPSTRAHIIDRLIQVDYIRRLQGTIIPTRKGLQLVPLVARESISSVSMTAQWEKRLQEIEQGKGDSMHFTMDIKEYVQEIVERLKHAKPVTPSIETVSAGSLEKEHLHSKDPTAIHYTVCYKCKQSTIKEGPNTYFCADKNCGFFIWKTQNKVYLLPSHIESLLKTGRTENIYGFKSVRGKRFGAYLYINDKFKVAPKFVPTGKKDLPKSNVPVSMGKGKKLAQQIK